MGLFDFFKWNQKEIVHDDFTQSKLRLAYVLFERLQSAMESHAQFCPNTHLSNKAHYGLINSFEYWQSTAMLPMVNEYNILKNMKWYQNTDSKREYKRYQKPCYDFIRSTVMPSFHDSKEKYTQNPELSFKPEGEINDQITEWDEAVQHGQRVLIRDIYASFFHLAAAVPGKYTAKDLDGVVTDLAQKNEMSVLENFLAHGIQDYNIDISSILQPK